MKWQEQAVNFHHVMLGLSGLSFLLIEYISFHMLLELLSLYKPACREVYSVDSSSNELQYFGVQRQSCMAFTMRELFFCY